LEILNDYTFIREVTFNYILHSNPFIILLYIYNQINDGKFIEFITQQNQCICSL